MSVSRRDFMKLFGVSVASLLLTRCRFPVPVTCYAPMPPSPYPTDPLTARDRLRLYWLRFDELVQKTQEEATQDVTENTFGQQLSAGHRLALDELVAAGELTPSVADLVQEAYDAAIYHVWRSNAAMTCYAPMIVDYAPTSAAILVRQAEALNEVAGQESIDPQTLANAMAALEHDMAYYALNEEETQDLIQDLVQASREQGQAPPSFESIPLEITPDAHAAAQFIVDLLTGK